MRQRHIGSSRTSVELGNSFGYFSDDREDFLMIGRIADLLKKRGKLFLDLNDGEVLRNSFEARSSEWLDEKTLVNRERALARSGKRLISREIIYSLVDGLIADQIYAETLYSASDISSMLERTAFTDIRVHREAPVISTRNEDLGMLAHRMIVTAAKK
jgi:D-alanine-D-alanine ligase